MSCRYINHNTGDVVERDRPDLRLERLANWERLDPPDQDVIATIDLTDAHEALDALDQVGQSIAALPPSADPAVPVPPRNASRAAWADYAISRGMDPDTAGSMKRDELAARYLTD